MPPKKGFAGFAEGLAQGTQNIPQILLALRNFQEQEKREKQRQKEREQDIIREGQRETRRQGENIRTRAFQREGREETRKENLLDRLESFRSQGFTEEQVQPVIDASTETRDIPVLGGMFGGPQGTVQQTTTTGDIGPALLGLGQSPEEKTAGKTADVRLQNLQLQTIGLLRETSPAALQAAADLTIERQEKARLDRIYAETRNFLQGEKAAELAQATKDNRSAYDYLIANKPDEYGDQPFIETSDYVNQLKILTIRDERPTAFMELLGKVLGEEDVGASLTGDDLSAMRVLTAGASTEEEARQILRDAGFEQSEIDRIHPPPIG